MHEEFKRYLKRFRFIVTLVRISRRIKDFLKRVVIRKMWLIIRPKTIKSYFKYHPVRKLQIGAGTYFLKGWLNTDINPGSREVIYMDATKQFPFEDSVFDYVFSEHQIEHLTYNDGLFMLQECYRILKPGGRIRIATLDLEVLIGLYSPEKSDIQQQYIQWINNKIFPEKGNYRVSFIINNAFRNWGHKFIYDLETLQGAMEEAGFVDITRYVSGESYDENLRGIESHGKDSGNEDMGKFETMVLEAIRPIRD